MRACGEKSRLDGNIYWPISTLWAPVPAHISLSIERITLMTNAMSDDRERLRNGDWIVYNVAENENFDLTGSKIAILTENQREQMYYNNVEPEDSRPSKLTICVRW
jgi:hypothetical protein